MGVVYEAEQLSIGRRVALKVLPFAAMVDDRALQRFRNEIRAVGTLDHPNIVAVHFVGEERGVNYDAMQLVRGQSLAEVIAALRASVVTSQSSVAKNSSPTDHGQLSTDKSTTDHGQLTTDHSAIETQSIAAIATERTSNPREFFRRVAEVGIQAAEALQHAHEQGIVHRDIKPANLLLDQCGKLYVTDFGLARLENDASMTGTGDLLGTLRYMSPDQISGNRATVDHRSDVYSLGVTLYELATLKPAFQASDRHQLLQQIAYNEPKPPSRIAPSVPRDLETILLKAIAKEPHARYASADGFAADLRRFTQQRPITARRQSRLSRSAQWARRNRTVAAFAALVLLLLLTMAIGGSVAAMRQAALKEQAIQSKQEAERARTKSEDLRYPADMFRAMRALVDRDLRLVRRLLKGHHPSADGADRRGWEWYYLWRACRDRAPTLRHNHIVNDFTISPDGGTLVSCDAVGRLNLWDVSTHRLLDATKAHDYWAWNVEFSPDGAMLASAGVEEAVRLWRIDPHSSTFISDGVLESNGWKWCVTFSPDGKLLASGGGTSVRLWDLSTREVVAELPEGQPCFGLSFRHDGEALAAHCGTRVVVWQSPYENKKKPSWVIDGFQNIAWLDVAFSPDGSWLAASWKKDGVKVWDVDSREPIHWFKTNMAAHSIAFAPDGKTLAIGNLDKTVSIWDTATGTRLDQLRGHSSAICCVRYAPDGKTLASSSMDQTVRLSPLDRNNIDTEQPNYPPGYSGPVEALSLSADGKWAATTNGLWVDAAGSKVVLWDTKTWRAARVFAGTGFAFSPDSRLLAVAGLERKEVRLWDLHADRFVGQIPGSVPLAFSPDGHLAAVGTAALDLWDPWDTKQPVAALRAADASFGMSSLMTMEFSPDGRTLAVTDVRGGIALLDPKTLDIVDHAKEALELWGHHTAFSPDGRYLVTPDYDHTVKVWDVRDGTLQLRHRLSGHTDSAISAAFSQDELLAVGCSNGQVKFWDSATWKERATLKYTDRTVGALCFSSDASTLVAGSNDGIIRILRAASPEEVLEAERRGLDPLSVD